MGGTVVGGGDDVRPFVLVDIGDDDLVGGNEIVAHHVHCPGAGGRSGVLEPVHRGKARVAQNILRSQILVPVAVEVGIHHPVRIPVPVTQKMLGKGDVRSPPAD